MVPYATVIPRNHCGDMAKRPAGPARELPAAELPQHAPEQFDRIVSIGMFEHVGHMNHAVFIDVVHRHLARDGVFLLPHHRRRRRKGRRGPLDGQLHLPQRRGAIRDPGQPNHAGSLCQGGLE